MFRFCFSAPAAAGCLLALLLAAGATRADAPAGTQPLSEEREGLLQELLAETVRIRGLEPPTRLLTGEQLPAATRSFLESTISEELADEKLSGLQRVLEWFGVIPEGLDLRAAYTDLLSSQVAGYFDLDSEYLVVVDGPTAEIEQQFESPEIAALFENSIFVHEINHALQHEHFDLNRLTPDEPAISDEQTAAAALIEGDSTLVMYSYMFGFGFERFRTGGMRSMLENPAELIQMSPWIPGGKELLTAPAYLRDMLMFPYLSGLLFCTEVQAAGGHKLLNHALASDPPASTEQILHPDKWITNRDDPVMIEVPAGDGDYRLAESGTWGEFGIRLVLAERLPGAEVNERIGIAQGWGGDAFGLYRNGSDEVLVWATEWDNPDEAREFLQAARDAFPGWRVKKAGKTRVVLHTQTGNAAMRDAKRLSRLFARADSSRRGSTAPDFAALGIGKQDIPKPLSAREYMSLLDHPVLKDMFEAQMESMDEERLEALFEDEDFNAQMAEMMEDGFAEEMDTLIADSMPAMSVTEGVFEVPEHGLTMTVPAGAGWESMEDPGTGALMVVNADYGATISLGMTPVPEFMPLSSLGVAMRMQFESQGLFETTSGETVVNGQPAFRGRYVSEDEVVIVDLSVIRIGGFGLTVGLTRPGAADAELGLELDSVLGSLKLQRSQ